LAPAARLLLEGGWLTLGLLGASYWALGRITGGAVRNALATGSLALISVGVLAGAIGILAGLQTGVPALPAPLWARAIMTAGFLLAAVAVVGISRSSGDRLGAAGWYLTAAPIWLTVSSAIGLIPTSDGITGILHAGFVGATITGLFVVTASVGLIYAVIFAITDTDPTEARPLASLGFWSLTVVWANLSAVPLIYTPAPDWYETISIAFAIAALVPLLTIAGDIALLVRGRVGDIGDRASLRLTMVSGISLAAATLVGLLWAWRATSAVIQYSPWVDAVWALIVLGGASFAIFAAVSVMKGGSVTRTVHGILSTVGLTIIALGTVAGGVAVGFSWAAGPASQEYANAGAAWKVTIDTAEPFAWVVAIGAIVFFIGQIALLGTLGRRTNTALAQPTAELPFDLELEGAPRYATWSRLMWGTAGVWLFGALMTLILPIADDADRDGTLLADTSRTYASGSAEAVGRDLYISEGCISCHTQVVRPVGTDVGLGPVSIAGDYANEGPALLGAHRLGPDLMHYASRGEFFDPVLVLAHLEDPRRVTPWSTMPSYSYLSGDELAALVSYLETLR
ncbi:MAG: cbb3-type cytochrome c oxidase subunit II, partial [Deltaproteobacteria bacterium]|nr:cbb3-type cytochrome c oxidase subunit II [Deltaproteobacteria bacterium]